MKNALRLGLIDDDESGLDNLKELISSMPDYQVAFATTNSEEGFRLSLDREADIVITDILMPEIGGLYLSGKLLELNIPVILCSGYPKYLLDGYKVSAADFLLKPTNYELLRKALFLASEKLGKIPQMNEITNQYDIYIKCFGSATLEKINLLEVRCIEQKRNYSYFHLENQDKVALVPLNRVILKLPPNLFIRVHRSFVVNLKFVTQFKVDSLEVDNHKVIPIGRTYDDLLRSVFKNRILG